MRFRRRPGDYDDADEAAEEPVWQSYRHLKPIIENMKKFKREESISIRSTTGRWVSMKTAAL